MTYKVRLRKSNPSEEQDLEIVIDCVKELGLKEVPTVSCPIFRRETNIVECSCQCSLAAICKEYNMFEYIIKKCGDDNCLIDFPCSDCIATIHKTKALIMVLQSITGFKDNIRYRSLKYMNMIDGSKDKFYQRRLIKTVKSLRNKKKNEKSSNYKF